MYGFTSNQTVTFKKTKKNNKLSPILRFFVVESLNPPQGPQEGSHRQIVGVCRDPDSLRCIFPQVGKCRRLCELLA